MKEPSARVHGQYRPAPSVASISVTRALCGLSACQVPLSHRSYLSPPCQTSIGQPERSPSPSSTRCPANFEIRGCLDHDIAFVNGPPGWNESIDRMTEVRNEVLDGNSGCLFNKARLGGELKPELTKFHDGRGLVTQAQDVREVVSPEHVRPVRVTEMPQTAINSRGRLSNEVITWLVSYPGRRSSVVAGRCS